MAKKHQVELLRLQYMPDPVTGRFADFGVIVRERDVQRGFAGVKFAADWRTVKCVDPNADVELLQSYETEIERLLQGGAENERVLGKLQEYMSNAVQFSVAKGIETDDPAEELEAQYELYVVPPKARRGEESTLDTLRKGVKNAFVDAGVWPLMWHAIKASAYTHRGDPLKIDCGYRYDGQAKLFQAVSLNSDVNTPKALAYSFPELKAGVQRIEKLDTVLIAVVDDNLRRERDEIDYALQAMERAGIEIAVMAEMPLIAERARIELRV